jgi:hypothetical protein
MWIQERFLTLVTSWVLKFFQRLLWRKFIALWDPFNVRWVMMFRGNLFPISRAENSCRHMELCHTLVDVLKFAVLFDGYYCQISTLFHEEKLSFEASTRHKKFHTLYGARSFVVILKAANYQILCSARLHQHKHTHTSIRFHKDMFSHFFPINS